MTLNNRPAAFFIADHPALDFLNSFAAPWGQDIEWLQNGQDLLDWLEEAQLISSDDAKQIDAQNSTRQLNQTAQTAIELREWFRNFIVKNAGAPIVPNAIKKLEKLNDILATDQAYRQIELPNLKWQQKRHWRDANDLLLPLANAMGDLLCDANISLVKNCGGETCGMWFLDISKNHKRHWCTMSICGNRAKAAAHRAKKRKSLK